ncbi:hypothetical protein C1H76_7512 [Elsinoe australis]|uniref:DUF7730 domain-containing protein n=1 Tax=Elsinoe australis TaxID=40998 RepID=A0A4U7AZ56_9PEZI|nr:hypothetical protein C1H76_7512 [Elsinoe australis]
MESPDADTLSVADEGHEHLLTGNEDSSGGDEDYTDQSDSDEVVYLDHGHIVSSPMSEDLDSESDQSDDDDSEFDFTKNFSGPFPLQKLPVELHRMIYREIKALDRTQCGGGDIFVTFRHFKHWFAGMRKVYRTDHYKKSPGPCTKRKCNLHYVKSLAPGIYGLTFSCRHFFTETLPVLYEGITFVMDYPCFRGPHPNKIPKFPAGFHWDLVKSIEITVDSLSNYAPYFVHVMDKLDWGSGLTHMALVFDDEEMHYQIENDSEGDEMAVGTEFLESALVKERGHIKCQCVVRIDRGEHGCSIFEVAETKRQASIKRVRSLESASSEV